MVDIMEGQPQIRDIKNNLTPIQQENITVIQSLVKKYPDAFYEQTDLNKQEFWIVKPHDFYLNSENGRLMSRSEAGGESLLILGPNGLTDISAPFSSVKIEPKDLKEYDLTPVVNHEAGKKDFNLTLKPENPNNFFQTRKQGLKSQPVFVNARNIKDLAFSLETVVKAADQKQKQEW